MKEKIEHRLYRVWEHMKERCSNPNCKAFKWYGGRGISVCKEWRENFKMFYDWAKTKHKKGLQIDRRDNDGNYTPENCRFVTHLENMRNRRCPKLNIVKVKEIKKLLAEGRLLQKEIARKFGIGKIYLWKIKTGRWWADV